MGIVPLHCYPGGAILRISDNGRGFMADNGKSHRLGLDIMRERAEQIGARLAINSVSQEGTEIMVEWAEAGVESQQG